MINLYNIYINANGWPLVVALISSFLCMYIYFEVYNEIKHNHEISFLSDIVLSKLSYDARKILAILFHLIMIIILILGSNYFVNKICASEDVRCMPEGTYCYYVKATNEKDKTYTLPAKIKKYNLSEY